jgi:hypothetical protein
MDMCDFLPIGFGYFASTSNPTLTSPLSVIELGFIGCSLYEESIWDVCCLDPFSFG